MTDTPSETRNRLVLSLKQRIAIHEQLKTVCFPVSESRCIYREGWSDHEVAEVMPFDCNTNHVHSIRTEMLGQLDKSQGSIPAELIERIASLEARVDELEKKQWPVVVNELDPRISKPTPELPPSPKNDPSMQSTSEVYVSPSAD